LPGLLEIYPALRLACNSKDVVLFKTAYNPTQQKLKFVCYHCGEYYGHGLMGYEAV
jgi:hypothetical protein